MAKGPLGNSPRDLRDDFVGDNVLFEGGEPPKKTRGPKRVKSNTFHSKVEGGTAPKRADRAGHFRRGGFVKGKYQDGGGVEAPTEFVRQAREMADVQPPIQTRQVPSVGSQSDILPIPPPIVPVRRRLSTEGGSPADDSIAYDPSRSELGDRINVTRTERAVPSEFVPLPRPRPRNTVSLPVSRPVVAQPRVVVRPPDRFNTIPGGPGSANYGGAGYKKGGSVKKKEGGVLTARARQSLPSSSFALPGQGKGPKGAGSGSYPIPDESYARNALARASGKPIEAKVRAKVHAKYPGIGQK